VVRPLTILVVFGSIAGAQTVCRDAVQPVSGHMLRLRVYDVADVPQKIMNRALETARTIFANAGITTCWEQGQNDSREANFIDRTAAAPGQHLTADNRSYLAVKIMRAPRDFQQEALGYALPFAHNGPHAFVFYDRVEDRLSAAVISIDQLLGNAIAHEVGHALMESSEHSVQGVMKSSWNTEDFRRAATSFLKFTPAEARVLQEHARRRTTVTMAKGN
jgi:hypothetical protein